MDASAIWAPAAVVMLGAWHGLNPGMGWLFAAALGMQEGRARAAWRALPPLALGHALAVGVTVAVGVALGARLPGGVIRTGVGLLLVGYGVLRLVWRRHPRFGGMRVGGRDLTLWSFLMASAHGAGLMVLPFIPLAGRESGAAGVPGGGGVHPELVDSAAHAVHAAHATGAAHAAHAAHASLLEPGALGAWGAILLHTGAYLLVTGGVALAVVAWLGLRWLRAFWVDLDRVWAVALVVTGVVALLARGGAP